MIIAKHATTKDAFESILRDGLLQTRQQNGISGNKIVEVGLRQSVEWRNHQSYEENPVIQHYGVYRRNARLPLSLERMTGA